jgi:hypothetical protein
MQPCREFAELYRIAVCWDAPDKQPERYRSGIKVNKTFPMSNGIGNADRVLPIWKQKAACGNHCAVTNAPR